MPYFFDVAFLFHGSQLIPSFIICNRRIFYKYLLHKRTEQMGKILSFLLIIICVCNLFSQQKLLNIERAEEFIFALINNSDSLEQFIYPEERVLSNRLGINYEGIKYKFLISYEIPQQIVEKIRERNTKYTLNIEMIDEGHSILHFKTENYETKYYFKSGFLISPPYFYYKDWQKIESEHFIFYVSEPSYFNRYSIDKLETFLENIFSVLKFTEGEKKILQKEKLIYILCKDEDEIEKLTGYKARGMGNLAYDYVITTYNCHYHELLHVLMNFKLKVLPLYTHPFFQEGFAVALGGRGGYEPGIILNLGIFLEQSEFLKVNQLFSTDEYRTFDVSMSYPLSGLYNSFLINEIGIDEYIKLYVEYSSNNVNGLVINKDKLPTKLNWNDFVTNYSNEVEIKIDFWEEDFQTIGMDSTYILKANEEFYLVESKGNIIISTKKDSKNYISKIFNETYPKKKYNSEKYLIKVNDSEVAVYNLFSNNLIANYVSGFSTDMKQVPKENNLYRFLINQAIFDEKATEWIIKVQD